MFPPYDPTPLIPLQKKPSHPWLAKCLIKPSNLERYPNTKRIRSMARKCVESARGMKRKLSLADLSHSISLLLECPPGGLHIIWIVPYFIQDNIWMTSGNITVRWALDPRLKMEKEGRELVSCPCYAIVSGGLKGGFINLTRMIIITMRLE